ncbi:MAG: histidine kinase dimerization/phospho-acceptor domain-containing protein [Promethearchaeota archaeon]
MDDLKTSNKILEEFIYRISHEIKTPLTSIANFLLLLLKIIEFKLEDKSKHYIDRIEKNVDIMKELIVGVLKNYNSSKKKSKKDEKDIILLT